MSALKDPRWLALPESQRDRLLEEHRDWNINHGWWGFTYDMFRDRCEKFGIHAEDISFSGFWSQGDGASFAGYVEDWSKVLRAIGRRKLKAKWREHDRGNDWSCRIDNRSRYYCHSACMLLILDAPLPSNPYDEDEEVLQHDAWEIANKFTDADYDDLHNRIIALCRALADWLYRELEEEYDYLTSDEAVAESILANFTDEELAADRREHGEEEEEEEEETESA